MLRIKRFLPVNRIDLLFAAIAIPLLVRLLRISTQSASDFEVYWHAVRAWTTGLPPYAQYSTCYAGLVFKYPPWILPLFLPLVFLSLPAAKWVWTLLQVLAIGYTIYWARRQVARTWVALLVALMFWWMWLAHTEFGQIMVFLLALGVGIKPSQAVTNPPRKNQNKSHKKSPQELPKELIDLPRKQSWSNQSQWAFLSFLFTAKIFSVVSLLGAWRNISQRRVVLIGLGYLVLAHLVLIVTSPGLPPNWLVDLYRAWMDAAFSGGEQLGATIVRGQQNHGFVAVFLRIFDVNATLVHFDIFVALALALGLSGLWHYFSRSLSFQERWVGWLALGVIVHPLAWHHSFVMAYPLCVLSLDRAIQTKQKSLIALAFFGAACITLLIPQVIGTEMVVPLEYVANKSWGVVFSAVALILSHAARRD